MAKNWDYEITFRYTRKAMEELPLEALNRTGSLAIRTVHQGTSSALTEVMAGLEREDIGLVEIRRIF